MTQIQIKRAYAKVLASDGKRILVDRLWPRGLKKENAKIDLWPKEITPSTELRKWYAHDPEHWEVFQRCYKVKLLKQPEILQQIRQNCTPSRTPPKASWRRVTSLGSTCKR